MLLLPLMMAAALSAEPAQTPAGLLDGLAGSCWRTDMPGDTTDTHCFTLSAGGKLGLDVHKVRTTDGKVVYEGVTAYRPEAGSAGGAGSGAVTFGYYNSLGDLMTGAAARDGADLHILLEMPGGPVEVTWHITPDGYDVSGATLPGQAHFTKIGPAPEGGL